MPEHFWDWFKKKKYDDILSEEACFRNKAFLIGCCIEFLLEKDQKITRLHEYTTMDEIIQYLQLGVTWTN